MDSQDPIQCVLDTIQLQGLTVFAFVNFVLNTEGAPRDSLIHGAPELCEKLLNSSPETVFNWSFNLVKTRIGEEVVELMNHRHGLQFNASKAVSGYLEGSFMQVAAVKMQEVAPWLWMLLLFW